MIPVRRRLTAERSARTSLVRPGPAPVRGGRTHEDRVHDRRSRQDLQGQPADHHPLLRQRAAQGLPRARARRFRRIPREALYKFMKDNGIPTDALESGKRKVLLVDDDAELVELITKVLDEDGRFEVRIASNGFDAGMMVKEYRPDLIVLDVMLPDINGKEVCHRVRADTTLEDVRILCISRHGRGGQDPGAEARRGRRLPAQAVRHRGADRPHVRPARDGAGRRCLTTEDRRQKTEDRSRAGFTAVLCLLSLFSDQWSDPPWPRPDRANEPFTSLGLAGRRVTWPTLADDPQLIRPVDADPFVTPASCSFSLLKFATCRTPSTPGTQLGGRSAHAARTGSRIPTFPGSIGDIA